MKSNVNITVIQSNKTNSRDIGYSLKGRLLGACNTVEATKIAQNWPVVERVLTSETSTLEKSVAVMKEINEEYKEEGFGHLVVALSSLSHLENTTLLEVFTKQLFISPPINLFSETPNKDSNGPFSINMECGNNSLITVENCEDE